MTTTQPSIVTTMATTPDYCIEPNCKMLKADGTPYCSERHRRLYEFDHNDKHGTCMEPGCNHKVALGNRFCTLDHLHFNVDIYDLMFEDQVNESSSPVVADRRRALRRLLDSNADPNSKECAMPDCTREKANGTPFCKRNENHKALMYDWLAPAEFTKCFTEGCIHIAHLDAPFCAVVHKTEVGRQCRK
ncbi:hypothetical protein E3Q08_04467 [Wallemia mellicola]|uniref:CxC6 like cysteine cluster associated with KDZ domain-containing protein n=1 Tax=Wallemia mellicola TaxID=1708541 RepID=A0AB38MB77_9BASI|nr:hypothetical protein E3Q24_04474 [Wallemia mellicola]TIB76412.1 hypothetical protein E3Q21_04464 [Wallemia mellicola]TIB80773.1 hypothetical protein E3Q20_04495 [Wallemia mellicola]TIC34872.1 hypothetical protein E3Q08_04467 [Wallemia mellicola]TIC35452.1 hypothetical protein E3Q07_04460 [Wallemia mellicola]